MFKKIKDKLKNNKALMISLVAVLIILIGGVSYAAYDYSFTGKDSKLESGSVSIKFLESNTNVIDLKNALPINDSEGKKGNSFDFVVTTKASYKTGLKYDLSVEKLSVDSGYTSLSDNQVKIYLTDYSDSSLLEPTLISGLDNNKIYSKTNKHSSANTKITDKYKLRVWVDSNVDASSWDQDTKLEYKFKIDVNSQEVSLLQTGTDFLVSKVGTDGLEKITHEADSSLQIGASEAITEYRYRGSNPNNYVNFNNESWRIIGVFPAEGEDGTIKDRIKLIRSESIGNAYWDNSDGTTGLGSKSNDYIIDDLIDNNSVSNDDFVSLAVVDPSNECRSSNGSNNWADSSLNKYLNSNYYDGLSENSIIDTVKYYLGGFNVVVTQTSSSFYNIERQSSSGYFYSGNPKNALGKISLMYVSDYGYATSNECTSYLDSYNSDICKNNNWLFSASNENVLTPNLNDGAVCQIDSKGGVLANSCVNVKRSVRPVLYLKADIKVADGDGTSNNPYIFE